MSWLIQVNAKGPMFGVWKMVHEMPTSVNCNIFYPLPPSCQTLPRPPPFCPTTHLCNLLFLHTFPPSFSHFGRPLNELEICALRHCTLRGGCKGDLKSGGALSLRNC